MGTFDKAIPRYTYNAVTNSVQPSDKAYIDDIFDPIFNQETRKYLKDRYGSGLYATLGGYSELLRNVWKPEDNRWGILGPGMGLLSTFGRSMDKAGDVILGTGTELVKGLTGQGFEDPFVNIFEKDQNYTGRRALAALANSMSKFAGGATVSEEDFGKEFKPVALGIELATDPSILGGSLMQVANPGFTRAAALTTANNRLSKIGKLLRDYDDVVARASIDLTAPGLRQAIRALKGSFLHINENTATDYVDVPLRRNPYENIDDDTLIRMQLAGDASRTPEAQFVDNALANLENIEKDIDNIQFSDIDPRIFMRSPEEDLIRSLMPETPVEQEAAEVMSRRMKKYRRNRKLLDVTPRYIATKDNLRALATETDASLLKIVKDSSDKRLSDIGKAFDRVTENIRNGVDVDGKRIKLAMDTAQSSMPNTAWTSEELADVLSGSDPTKLPMDYVEYWDTFSNPNTPDTVKDELLDKYTPRVDVQRLVDDRTYWNCFMELNKDRFPAKKEWDIVDSETNEHWTDYRFDTYDDYVNQAERHPLASEINPEYAPDINNLSLRHMIETTDMSTNAATNNLLQKVGRQYLGLPERKSGSAPTRPYTASMSIYGSAPKDAVYAGVLYAKRKLKALESSVQHATRAARPYYKSNSAALNEPYNSALAKMFKDPKVLNTFTKAYDGVENAVRGLDAWYPAGVKHTNVTKEKKSFIDAFIDLEQAVEYWNRSSKYVFDNLSEDVLSVYRMDQRSINEVTEAALKNPKMIGPWLDHMTEVSVASAKQAPAKLHWKHIANMSPENMLARMLTVGDGYGQTAHNAVHALLQGAYSLDELATLDATELTYALGYRVTPTSKKAVLNALGYALDNYKHTYGANLRAELNDLRAAASWIMDFGNTVQDISENVINPITFRLGADPLDASAGALGRYDELKFEKTKPGQIGKKLNDSVLEPLLWQYRRILSNPNNTELLKNPKVVNAFFKPLQDLGIETVVKDDTLINNVQSIADSFVKLSKNEDAAKRLNGMPSQWYTTTGTPDSMFYYLKKWNDKFWKDIRNNKTLSYFDAFEGDPSDTDQKLLNWLESYGGMSKGDTYEVFKPLYMSELRKRIGNYLTKSVYPNNTEAYVPKEIWHTPVYKGIRKEARRVTETAAEVAEIANLPEATFVQEMSNPATPAQAAVQQVEQELAQGISEDVTTRVEQAIAEEERLSAEIEEMVADNTPAPNPEPVSPPTPTPSPADEEASKTWFQQIKEAKAIRTTANTPGSKASAKYATEVTAQLKKLDEIPNAAEHVKAVIRLGNKRSGDVLLAKDFVNELFGSGVLHAMYPTKQEATSVYETLKGNADAMNAVTKRPIAEVFMDRIPNNGNWHVGIRLNTKNTDIVSDIYKARKAIASVSLKDVVFQAPEELSAKELAYLAGPKAMQVSEFLDTVSNVAKEYYNELGFPYDDSSYFKNVRKVNKDTAYYLANTVYNGTNLDALEKIVHLLSNVEPYRAIRKGAFGSVLQSRRFRGNVLNFNVSGKTSAGTFGRPIEIFEYNPQLYAQGSLSDGIFNNTNFQSFVELTHNDNWRLKTWFEDLDDLNNFMRAGGTEGRYSGNYSNIDLCEFTYKDGRVTGIKRYNTYNPAEVKKAFDNNAIFLPSNVIDPLDKILRKEIRMSNSAYRFINRAFTTPFKIGVLTNFGFLIGNANDAWLKQATTYATKYGTPLPEELANVGSALHLYTSLGSRYNSIMDKFYKAAEAAGVELTPDELIPSLAAANPGSRKTLIDYIRGGFVVKSGGETVVVPCELSQKEIGTIVIWSNLQTLLNSSNVKRELDDLADMSNLSNYDTPQSILDRIFKGAHKYDSKRVSTWGVFMNNPVVVEALKCSETIETLARGTAILNDLIHAGYTEDEILKCLADVTTGVDEATAKELRAWDLDFTAAWANAENAMYNANFNYEKSSDFMDDVSKAIPFPVFFLKNLAYWLTLFVKNPQYMDHAITVHDNIWEGEPTKDDKFAAEAKGRGAIPVNGQNLSKAFKGYFKPSPLQSMFGAFSLLQNPQSDITYRLHPLIQGGLQVADKIIPGNPLTTSDDGTKYRPYSTNVYEKNVTPDNPDFDPLKFTVHRLNPYERTVNTYLRTPAKVRANDAQLSDFVPSVFQPKFAPKKRK